ncbi:MAG: CPBP family intramembrane metalloprotease [Sedimentisphaerales bacterium]|nr:CPBP family intramembrane metalloprotease [Sedimentisphaerales bacterium]
MNGSHKYGGLGCLLTRQPSHEVTLRPSTPTCVVGQPAALAVETAVVAVAVITTIRLLDRQPALDCKWFLTPCLLVIAALLPTWLRGSRFPPLCTDRRDAMTSVVLAFLMCLCALPVVFLGLWLMVRMGLSMPVRPVATGLYDRLTWLVYQFLYVAVAEEVFFRGYLQTNVMRSLGDARPRRQQIAIVTSAGCFALAHVVVQGQIASVLTFLPGLILAWLLIRTRSLLAPILFHGLANVSYGVIAKTLT